MVGTWKGIIKEVEDKEEGEMKGEDVLVDVKGTMMLQMQMGGKW